MSALTEDANQVAFILAFAAHLDALKKKLDAVSEDPSSTIEQSCHVDELSIGLRVVKNYGLRTLANGSDGTRVHGTCALLSAHILGGSLKRKLVLLSTEELISRVDDREVQANPLVQDPILMSKLYKLLQVAVQMASNMGHDSEDPLLVELYISRLLVSYLASQEAADPLKISLGSLSSATLSYLKGAEHLQADVSWEAVYALFKNLLSLQINLVPYSLTHVLEAREVGNNLMANCSYPQALKVYTEAIEGAGFSALNNLPQLYTNRAIAFIGLNCFSEAVTDLQTAVLQDRTFTPAWVQLGYCHLFLGLGLLALKCYLVALRTMAGEIFPLHFPTEVALRQEYTEAKLKTVFPQFVQKLVLSILLTEKRAEQQQEPASAIQEITARVRAILARLRSYASAEDIPFLSYVYETDIDSIRAAAARANRVRPNILNPDVAQDILSSTGVEASAVTILPPPIAAFTTHAVPNQPNFPQSPPAETREANTPANQEPSIREMFNNLGEVFASVIPDQTPNREPQTQPGSDTNATDASASAATSGPTLESLGLNLVPRAIASVQRALAPSNNGNERFNVGGLEVAGGLSNLVSQALRNHQAAYERTLAETPEEEDSPPRASPGIRVTVHHHRPRNVATRREGPRASEPARHTQRNSEQRSGPSTPRPEDTEMPDAQDLD